MLRLQAPLPDDYTLATDDELVARIARRQGSARRPAADPRPPLPARRGDPLGRPGRRLVQARAVRGGQRPRDRHRLLRRALHGRVGRRAHRRPPAGDPPRPERGLLDGRHGRHRPGRGGVGGDRRRHRDRPRRPDHVHELVRGAEGVRRPARRRGVHVVERAGGARVGVRTRRQGALLPGPAPRPQHRLHDGLHRDATCACGTRATSSAGSRSAKSRTRRSCCGRATARCTSASVPSTSRRRAPSTPASRSSCTPSARTTSSRSPTRSARPSASRSGSQDGAAGRGDGDRHRDPHGAAPRRAAPRQDDRVARPADLPVRDDVPHRRAAPRVGARAPRRRATS